VTQGVVSNPAASLGPNQVFLRQLAAPLNPADFNLVEGTYGVKASLPAIGGNEGLFRVEAASPTSALKAGDWVIPIVPNFGTWRSHAVADDFAFMKVPQTVSEVDAATVSVNPCTGTYSHMTTLTDCYLTLPELDACTSVRCRACSLDKNH
jgi:NADPH:quinone reductase-like Zn-dependent oxidoreductase